jgi:hypothetical protein
MSSAVPNRVTAVFAGLVVATCVTWWLGSESSLNGLGFEMAAALTLLIAFGKIVFIGADFMELREAPTVLRTVFLTWVVVFAAAAIALVAF